MKRLMLVIMASLLLVSIGFAEEEESEDAVGYEEYVFDSREKKSEDIVGYGEYILGSAPSDFDLSEFTKEIGEVHGVDVVTYGQHDYDFAISAGKTTVHLLLIFEEGKLENIMLIFEALISDIGGLDDIKIFVKGLRNVILDKYDSELVETDRFGFEYEFYADNYLEGLLGLEDEDGDAIWIHWDGYDLTLHYFTASFWEAVSEGVDAKADEGESKL